MLVPPGSSEPVAVHAVRATAATTALTTAKIWVDDEMCLKLSPFVGSETARRRFDHATSPVVRLRATSSVPTSVPSAGCARC